MKVKVDRGDTIQSERVTGVVIEVGRDTFVVERANGSYAWCDRHDFSQSAITRKTPCSQ